MILVFKEGSCEAIDGCGDDRDGDDNDDDDDNDDNVDFTPSPGVCSHNKEIFLENQKK
jgi:hypothetical protein